MALIPMIRFRPFSHQPKTSLLIPGSTLSAEIYPTKLLVFDLAEAHPVFIKEINFREFGPLNKFCVVADLEKGEIVVTGESRHGYVRYSLYALQAKRSFCLSFKKAPTKMAPIIVGEKEAPRVVFAKRERLFLGVDKAQEWSQVLRRGEIKEIMPLWYWLSQSIEYPPVGKVCGPSLLASAETGTLADSKNLFRAAFSELLVPRLVDTDYQGFSLPIAPMQEGSPLIVLQKSFGFIRRFFYREEANTIALLPNLPQEFHYGTLSNICTQKGHKLSIEWTKHTIRRLFIEAACDDEVDFIFQKEIKQFRYGKTHLPNGECPRLISGRTYLFDHFEK